MDHDVLVIGAGVAGMESALSLGDMGYKVLLVEKEPSIGGKMILLSKVFPTLDCASCISTPKMASTAHHPQITTLIRSEVRQIRSDGEGGFLVEVEQHPTFVDHAACTGCQDCERACTVAQPDRFNYDLAGHRAAYIAFPQAIPKKAVIERRGQSPCSFTCPAGVKAHGYVSLVRAGRYADAFNLHLEDAPLPGSLGRVCYAPCEGECTQQRLAGSVTIRGIKRFFADHYYQDHPVPEYGPPAEQHAQKVAVVGSGPAGLSAAYHLARAGYPVTVLEAEEQAGGMLRLGIPAYRLPKDVVDRDLLNVTALGVKVETGRKIEDLAGLKAEGYQAVFLATGAMEPRSLGVEGESLAGVTDCMTFLKEVNLGRAPDLQGKRVVVIGGGNAAIDPARTALRLGAAEVSIVYRRSREEMPAHDWEVEAAQAEGVQLRLLKTPLRFVGEQGRLTGMECQCNELGAPDAGGRRRPVAVAGSEHIVPVDLAILSIGLSPSTSPFAGQLELGKDGLIGVNPTTLQTSLPWVFAGGDVVTGPSMVVQAIGQGKRAAAAIDRFLRGEPLEAEDEARLPMADRDEVLGRFKDRPALTAHGPRLAALETRPKGFTEVEAGLTEEEARDNAGRCLDCGVCSECGSCVAACPAQAIRLDQRPRTHQLKVGSVILSTGFELFDPSPVRRLGHGRLKNVITSMQMERILAPTRPYNAVLRPSDGKVPDNIAYVLCAGSRDHSAGNPLCSRVCCMYSLKQAQLLMGAVPLADITIYYIDLRAYGKGYEEFLTQTRNMGTYLVRGKVAAIEDAGNGNLELVFEDIENGHEIRRMEHDLVVLSVGLLPTASPFGMFSPDLQLARDSFSYVEEVDGDLEPGRTSIPGVFVAGSASAAKDIPDTILHAGCAATQAAAYLQARSSRRSQP